MAIISALYVVYDGYDTASDDTAILLTTQYEHEAIMHAKELSAVVYRYDVTDDDDFINERLIYSEKE